MLLLEGRLHILSIIDGFNKSIKLKNIAAL